MRNAETTVPKTYAAALGALAAAAALAACGGNGDSGKSNAEALTTAAKSSLPQGSEPVELDPADFSTQIDNPYWPMRRGSRWVYRETDPNGLDQRVVVTVTPKTKKIPNGITARVVRDEVTEHGRPVEITDDWYAQDKAGNIWYMGEATKEYKNGKVATTEGSFEAGVDGAQAGIALPAKPRVGLNYRQEYYAGQAEDKGEVLSLDQQVGVPFGRFTGALMTRDTSPIEPKVNELKFYGRGVGPLLEIGISGGSDRAELQSYTKGK
jgi:hypothetical protein